MSKLDKILQCHEEYYTMSHGMDFDEKPTNTLETKEKIKKLTLGLVEAQEGDNLDLISLKKAIKSL